MIYSILMHWLIVLLLAPFLLGVIGQVKAFFAGKVGPSVFQPYFDLGRQFRKKCVFSDRVTWVFHAAPVVALTSILILSLLVPFGAIPAPVQFSGDVVLFVALLALVRFFMILAALDTGFSMEGMGASREAFFACLSEVSLFMNLMALALLSESLSLSRIVEAGHALSWSTMGPVLLLVAVSFFIVILVENCRLPVDDPDTHLELTMIHEAMILEHSGVDLAYLFYAAEIKLFVFFSILIPVVLPPQTGHPVVNMGIYAGGMLALAVVVGAVESSLARIRLNRVRYLLLISFALAFFGFIVMLWRGIAL